MLTSRRLQRRQQRGLTRDERKGSVDHDGEKVRRNLERGETTVGRGLDLKFGDQEKEGTRNRGSVLPSSRARDMPGQGVGR